MKPIRLWQCDDGTYDIVLEDAEDYPEYWPNIVAMNVSAEDLVNAKASADTIRKLQEHNAKLHKALELAQAHLDWIGWGDKYERECARDSGLETLIEEALK